MMVTDKMVEAGARAAWEHRTAHESPLVSWDELKPMERSEARVRFAAGLKAALEELPEPSTPMGQGKRVEVVAKALEITHDGTPLSDTRSAVESAYLETRARAILAALDTYDREKLREVTVGAEERHYVGEIDGEGYDEALTDPAVQETIQRAMAITEGRDGEQEYCKQTSKHTDRRCSLPKDHTGEHIWDRVEGRDGEDDREWTLERRFGEPFRVSGPDDERGPITVVPKSSRDARDREIDRLRRERPFTGDEIKTAIRVSKEQRQRAERAEDQVEKLRGALKLAVAAVDVFEARRIAREALLASSNSDGDSSDAS